MRILRGTEIEGLIVTLIFALLTYALLIVRLLGLWNPVIRPSVYYLGCMLE
jgi:hypothetical protein